MCSGSKWKATHTGFGMENEFGKQDGYCCDFSVLLELSASDDLFGFKRAVEEEGHDIDEQGMWYGRRIGSKKMRFEKRTSLMIAALYGSKDVLIYILESGCVDVNRVCGSDGATALHCAFVSGSASSGEIVKLLLDASADLMSVDANGNLPGELIVPTINSDFSLRRKELETILDGVGGSSQPQVLADHVLNETEEQEQQEMSTPRVSKDGTDKKEYPVDLTLPDIKNGIYGTDEFRMYAFKVKPCSRAYSHDWTECPFVHPGENARRRDPRKYHYSCVPCPEFRKGSCRQGDACEYAHGIFECWLHPAQYRTRLCKDEANCTRRVCFFAHKPEELRPLYASTGSAVPSHSSYSANGSTLDMSAISPLSLGSPSVLMSTATTPPMTPSGPPPPIGGWQNPPNIVPPALQLPGRRLKAALNARDVNIDMEFLGLESHRRQQQLMDEISGLSSPSSWNNGSSMGSAFGTSSVDRTGELNPINLEDIFGSLDPAIVPQLQGLSLDAVTHQLQSPTGIQMRQYINHQLCVNYNTSFSHSNVRTSPSVRIDQSGTVPSAGLSSRFTAFAKRSQSFIERSAVNRHNGFSSPDSSVPIMPSNLSDWGSPDGKLDWAIQGEELNKLRKSASFGFRSNGSSVPANGALTLADVREPDVSWVQSLVKDDPSIKRGQLGLEEHQQQCHLDTGGGLEILPGWVDQLYNDQEQMVA